MANATEIQVQIYNGQVQFSRVIHQDTIAGQDPADVFAGQAEFENIRLLDFATLAAYKTGLDASAVAAGMAAPDATAFASAVAEYQWAAIFDYSALVTLEDTSGSTP